VLRKLREDAVAKTEHFSREATRTLRLDRSKCSQSSGQFLTLNKVNQRCRARHERDLDVSRFGSDAATAPFTTQNDPSMTDPTALARGQLMLWSELVQ
jgi:hypothetical protein